MRILKHIDISSWVPIRALACGLGLNLALAVNVIVWAGQPVYAQTDKNVQLSDEGRKFSEKTTEAMNEALQLINSEQHSAAVSKLSNVLTFPGLNAYERSTIYQMQGASYYELNQYGPAISAFENAIEAGGLLSKEMEQLRVNIAQLLIGNGQYAQGAQMLEDYLKNGGREKPKYIELITQACIQSENYACALPWAEKWFRAANPKERKHFDLMNFLYNNLGQTEKQEDIVKDMIMHWPEDKFLWDAWASMLANGGREQDAFEVTKMLYLGGALNSEPDLMKVVQYYSFYDMPYQAAQILEREMDAGRIVEDIGRLKQLSSLFKQARADDQAAPYLEELVKLRLEQVRASKPDNISEYLANIYFDMGQCDKAETEFKTAMKTGYHMGRAWMMIGSCYAEDSLKQDRLRCGLNEAELNAEPITQSQQAAIKAFESVPSSAREKGNADKWIKFIKAEIETEKSRCKFKIHKSHAPCFKRLKDYAEEVFIGGLNTPEECVVYNNKYDTNFRIKLNPNPRFTIIVDDGQRRYPYVSRPLCLFRLQSQVIAACGLM